MADPLIRVTIEFPQAELDRLEREIGMIPRAVDKAKTSVINKTLAKIKTPIKRAVVSATGIPSSVVGKRIRVRKAYFKAGESISAGSLIFDGRNIKLRQAKKSAGPYYLGVKDQTPSAVSATFGVNFGEKTSAKFTRAGAKRPMQKGRYAGKTIRRGPRKGTPILRQPIKELHTAGIGKAVRANQAIIDQAVERAKVEMSAQVQSQIARFLQLRKRT